MNDTGGISNPNLEVKSRITRLFEAQRAAFQAAPYPSAAERIYKLRALKKQIGRYQDVLCEALSSDFGFRHATESKLLDLLGSVLDAEHAMIHLKRWMRPSRRRTELLFFSNSLHVTYQPKGVVGVIVPWNFPVYLALGPLIAALAAGNRVMLKLSEVTQATNTVLAQMLGEIFSADEVAVIGAELTDPNFFTALPFNHIVFTGSPAVGKIVMSTAAANLTPVTLELGGKSPAVVTRNYPLEDAALRITHGKISNCGQICVAPDYALVPRENVEAFITAVRKSYAGLCGDSKSSGQSTWVVNARHLARIESLLADARNKGANVIACAEFDAVRDGRQLPLYIVSRCTADMRILQEELFGPILLVIPYDTLDDAINFINSHERPLALYCFSHDDAERQHLLQHTHSGGVTINDWGWHVVNHDAPFGGVGHSGMGSYHGEEGFRELSHARTVLKRQRFFPTHWFYPPYGNFVQDLTLRYFLGKADPTLKKMEK